MTEYQARNIAVEDTENSTLIEPCINIDLIQRCINIGSTLICLKVEWMLKNDVGSTSHINVEKTLNFSWI
jgi:hypothetical protein